MVPILQACTVNLKTCYKTSHLTRSHTERPSEEILEKFERKKELLVSTLTRPCPPCWTESHSSFIPRVDPRGDGLGGGAGLTRMN